MVTSKQANMHMHVCNAVTLVWGSLRLTPIDHPTHTHAHTYMYIMRTAITVLVNGINTCRLECQNTFINVVLQGYTKKVWYTSTPGCIGLLKGFLV